MALVDSNFSDSPSIADSVELVRLMVGDTDRKIPQITDSIYETVIGAQPVLTYAAAVMADMLKAKYARFVDVTSGKTKVANSQKVDHYRQLAADLRAGGAGNLPGGDGTGVPTVAMRTGGTSRNERDAFRDDADRIQPSFRIGKDDHPGSPDSFEDLDQRD